MKGSFKELRKLPISLMKDLNLQLDLLDTQVLEFHATIKKLCIIYNKIINDLKNDFDKVIKCLAIYFGECVEKSPIKFTSPDIESLNIDCVLNFNYNIYIY